VESGEPLDERRLDGAARGQRLEVQLHVAGPEPQHVRELPHLDLLDPSQRG
jgi:hypothetical protein